MDDVSEVELASEGAAWIYEAKEHKARRGSLLLTQHREEKQKKPLRTCAGNNECLPAGSHVKFIDVDEIDGIRRCSGDGQAETLDSEGGWMEAKRCSALIRIRIKRQQFHVESWNKSDSRDSKRSSFIAHVAVDSRRGRRPQICTKVRCKQVRG